MGRDLEGIHILCQMLIEHEPPATLAQLRSPAAARAGGINLQSERRRRYARNVADR